MKMSEKAVGIQRKTLKDIPVVFCGFHRNCCSTIAQDHCKCDSSGENINKEGLLESFGHFWRSFFFFFATGAFNT